MSGLNFDDLFAAQRAVMNALVSVGNTALTSAERMAALHLHAVHEAMVDFAEGTQRMMAIQDPREVVDLQHELSRPQVEKGVRYSRSLAEISTAAQEDAVRLIEAQYSSFTETMSALANQIAKSTPGGSEVAVAAIHSAMRSANEAFGRFNEAVLRFTEVSEDSVSTMGNATVKAVTGKSGDQSVRPAKSAVLR